MPYNVSSSQLVQLCAHEHSHGLVEAAHHGQALLVHIPVEGRHRLRREGLLLQQLHLPNTDGSLLDEITFPLQDECPEVIFSYASRTDDEKGTAWMWMLASLLREAGITSYNARQTPVGGDWLKEWFGRMPDCKICVAMFSPAYFESDKCKNELYEAAGSHL